MGDVELVPCPNACDPDNGPRFRCRVCLGGVRGKVTAAMSVEYELLNIADFDDFELRPANDWCTAVDALRKRHGYG